MGAHRLVGGLHYLADAIKGKGWSDEEENQIAMWLQKADHRCGSNGRIKRQMQNKEQECVRQCRQQLIIILTSKSYVQ